MNEHFHILIAGENSRTRSFKFSKKQIVIFSVTGCITLCVLLLSSLFTASLYTYNKILTAQAKSAKKETASYRSINTDLEGKIASLMLKTEEDLRQLETQKNLLLTQLQLESSQKIAELEKLNLKQEMSFKEERDLLLSTAVNELNERSEFIENVISKIGIKVKQGSKNTQQQKNSGGPYISAPDEPYDMLLERVDNYLKTIRTLPVGKPVSGSVSSWYGRRKDPLNGKKAFHSGVDFRGRRGDPIYATADGKITFAGKNGGFGNYVKIDHQNGYATSFAHLHNYHVKKGDFVSRGQIIGLVGNTGRSTGTHLHYEITYKGKTVNPRKFMKVANLTCKFDSNSENE